jgi:assimilatory nitrate reductase electron transfer subunit
VTGTSVAEVLSADGALVAVRLTDGRVVDADLMLVSCGVRANVDLAAAAGLDVDRGIVVDEDLVTADARVHAIGDCAQSPDGMPGLLAPGWRQAERLARVLVGSPEREASPSTAAGEPVRLKAAGVDLVTMGVRASAARGTDRVVSLGDPSGRRHIDLVVRPDDGGEARLVGVSCLGAPDVSAALSVAFDRRTPLPADPLLLLVPDGVLSQESASPVRMPGSTTVCRCNGVSKKDIVAAWEGGAASVAAVATVTRATTGCGGCQDLVRGLVDWLAESDGDPGAVLTDGSAPLGADRHDDVTRRNIAAPSSS